MNGSLHLIDGRSVLRFERRLAHPVEKVWRAITEPDELAGWFPAQLDGERAPGAKIRFLFPAEEEPAQDGEILEYDPPRLFAYTWGGSVLRWELRPDGAGCLLLFSHTFDDRPSAASFATGWHGCLDALDRLLAGRPAPAAGAAEVAATWAYRARHEAYLEVFDLLAGTAEETADGWLVRFERLFPYPPDRVWAALTGGATPAAGEPAPGPATAGPTRSGTVTEAAESAVLAFRSGAGEVRWTLSPGPGGTLGVLTEQVPATGRVAALAGWHARLAALARELSAETAEPAGPEPATLQARYTELIG